MPRFFLLISFLLVTVTTPSAWAAGQNLSPTEIISALQKGGHVVYFRHGATTWMGVDQLNWPRSEQRLLSEKGIKESETIGTGFKHHGIPVGEVIASPFPRCYEMAEIAFGKVEKRMELLGLLSNADGRSMRIQFMKDKLAEVTGTTNRIIIAHRSNIAEAAGVSLGEGDAVIIRPDGKGGFDILGVMAPDQWLSVDMTAG